MCLWLDVAFPHADLPTHYFVTVNFTSVL
jgi:hypothetical protein